MASTSRIVPSTVDTGFILSVPPLANPYAADVAYQRVLRWYLPRSVLDVIAPQLRKFGDEAISERINRWVANAEKEQPYVKTHDVWGRRYPYDRLITSQGWKEVGAWGAKNGYEKTYHDNVYF